MGPNGAGKTSLLNIIAGLQAPTNGDFKWFNDQNWSVANEHNRVFLLQKNERVIQLKAHDIVSMGRFPFRNQESTFASNEKTQEHMSRWKIDQLKDRLYHTLSGGEQQRVHLARIWNQLDSPNRGPKVLLLDEPFTYLDLELQKELISQLETLKDRLPLTIVFVDHNLTNALKIADEILVMKNGFLHVHGSKEHVINSSVLSEVYEIETFTHVWDNQYFISI